MVRHQMMPRLGRAAALAWVACVAVATVRAVPGPSVSAPAANATVGADPLASAAAAPLAIDRRARQIVAAHPIIPAPSAVAPALVGLAFVARRVFRSSGRSTARYR